MTTRKPATAKQRVLLTNDDGYFSDGINTLFRVLSRKYDVFMVAPDREQSASSHSLTLNRPLRVHKIDDHRFTTDGTPTDCVMLAVHLLFKGRKPDIIVSGINHGGNMGDDVTYSGTVAAAIEGAILKVPSLAVSMAHYEPGMSFVNAAKFVARLIAHSPKLGLETNVFLNVNFPPDDGSPYTEFEFTRQGIRHYRDIVVRKTDPRGAPYYWIGGRPKWKSTKGSDFDAVNRGVVSISPMKLDFTDEDVLRRLHELRKLL